MRDEFTDYSDATKTYRFVESPKPNVKLSFGKDTTIYFEYHVKNIPNEFQRWILLKVFGIKLEKI